MPVASVKPTSFPPTRWSLVLSTQGEHSRALHAMNELCEAYWFPLFSYARQRGLQPADAEDATQGFFAMMLSKEMMSRVSPNAGRLRSYLIASFKNYIGSQDRRARAKKRGGGTQIISIDQEAAEGRYLEDLASGEDPEQAFVRRWALALLDSAMAGLRKDYESRGEGQAFLVLAPLLADFERGESFKAVALSLGITEASARVAVFRLRKRYGRAVREEVSETVADPDEIDSEIDALFEALKG